MYAAHERIAIDVGLESIHMHSVAVMSVASAACLIDLGLCLVLGVCRVAYRRLWTSKT